jgi:AcrR family transcriptional regulator
MKGKRVTRRKRQRRNSADALMNAALDLFSERDYASVSMQDVARHADITYSLVYYHFESKENLFNSALTNLIEKTVESYTELRGGYDDPVALIEAWFDYNIELSAPLRKMVKILFDYSGPQNRAPSVDGAIRRFYDFERGVIESAVALGVQQGVFAPVDPQRVACFVSTHMDGVFLDSIMRRENTIPQAIADLKWVVWRILDYDPEQVRSGAEAGRQRTGERRQSGSG